MDWPYSIHGKFANVIKILVQKPGGKRSLKKDAKVYTGFICPRI
jgi:hypothetical protein